MKKPFVVNDKFQWRYTGYLVLAIFCSVLLVGGPAFYFVNQNYNLFIQLAYQHAPELITHLERERVWINGFLIASCVGMIFFCSFFGIRMTARLIFPILRMHDHIENLIRGRWSQDALAIDKSEEFEDLLESYNYFYKLYQKHFSSELDYLIKIKDDPQSVEAEENLKELILQKSQQLNPVQNGVSSD